ncbi:sensor histidine kinase [Nonomuraea sp. CA-218870]|uniref:sensor histidine kinase n=1 Tax=Nonomuraea sp. CA-218870 TaxID=3239998 RepID=UPI003D92A0BD
MKGLRREDGRQVLKDVLLWGALAIVVMALGPDPLTDAGAFSAVTGPRLALAGAAVLVGRRWPAAAVALLLPLGPWEFGEALATSDLTWLVPGATEVKVVPFSPVSPFVIWYAYLTGRRVPLGSSPQGTGVIAGGGAIAVIGVVLVLAEGGAFGLWVTMVTGLLGVYVIPCLLGALRRRLLHQRDEARQAAEAQARLRERARIARDMHDSLGHDLALIAVRAAGLELSPALEPAQARAAGELRAAAADATDRLRRIIGVLSDDADAAPLTPPRDRGRPGARAASGDVAALVERARDSGLIITSRLREPFPVLAHAVVREGLTNAAKHAPGAEIDVTVTPHRIVVRNGPPARVPEATVTGGRGLTGLREQVRLAGGALSAGPSAGGYELAADLP